MIDRYREFGGFIMLGYVLVNLPMLIVRLFIRIVERRWP